MKEFDPLVSTYYDYLYKPNETNLAINPLWNTYNPNLTSKGS